MEVAVPAGSVSSDPVRAVPSVLAGEGTEVQRGAGLLRADVEPAAEHVAVPAGLHQVDLAGGRP